MVRGICDLGVGKGDAVRISKDRDGVYSVVLKDRSASRKRGGFS
jgi:hypothetical protein